MNISNKKKILFLANHFTMGGVQQVNLSLINNIDKNQFEVHVLYLKKGILFNDLSEDISIKNLGNTLKLKSIKNLIYLYRIKKYIISNNIDIVHTIDGVLYYLGAVAARLCRIKHIRTQPNFIRRHERKNTKTLKILPFEKWTDKFFTLNEASAKDLNLAGVNKNKISVIYGYYPLEEYLNNDISSDIKKEFNIPKKNKIIVAMHRMVDNKGYETFIDMIPLVVKKCKNVTFLLVGDGPNKDDYKSKVENLGVSKFVVFTGFRKDPSNISKQVDIGVYPVADTVAMGTVLRAGKVLITKKNSSMDEYIEHEKNGILVTLDTPETYASEVIYLLERPHLITKMEEHRIQFAKKNFDGKKNIRKFEQDILTLL